MKLPIEESIINFNLLNIPALGHYKGEHDVNGGSIDDKTEGFGEVNPMSLLKALCNKSGFVVIK